MVLVLAANVGLVDVLDIFNFFSARGGGRGSPRRWEGGGLVFYSKSHVGGGVSRTGWGRGAGRVSAANWGLFVGRGG